jgi:hypothetical protein
MTTKAAALMPDEYDMMTALIEALQVRGQAVKLTSMGDGQRSKGHHRRARLGDDLIALVMGSERGSHSSRTLTNAKEYGGFRSEKCRLERSYAH